MTLVFMLEEASMKALLEGLLPRILPADKFRDPDRIGSPSRVLADLVPDYAKVSGGRRLGPVLNLDNTRSPSFKNFVTGVRRLVESPPV